MYFLLVLSFLFLSCIRPIDGFCIYNESDDNTFYWIRQVAGMGQSSLRTSRFLAEHLRSGEKACCHYSNYDCSDKQHEKDSARFAFKRMWDGEPGDHRELGIFEIDIIASGYIVFGGNRTDPTIKAYYADHSPYPYWLYQGSDDMFNYSKYNSTTHNATLPETNNSSARTSAQKTPGVVTIRET